MAGNRAENLALGINLGWIQQGAAFGGRPRHELTADLERVRSHAHADGYAGFEAYLDAALRKLNEGQPPANIISGEINPLIGFFQGVATSHSVAQALNVGIALGWLQQGARANNRLVSLAISDLNNISVQAPLAGYHGHEASISAALSKLASGQPISTILNEVSTVITIFQSQN
jgi:hypothetical protein